MDIKKLLCKLLGHKWAFYTSQPVVFYIKAPDKKLCKRCGKAEVVNYVE